MSLSDLKPIQTSYNGYLFRSRLEARWAVFFDSLGISYEYEKEGFDLDSAGWYLPDFWLPEYQTWVEIKGDKPSEEELFKVKVLVLAGKTHVFLFEGLPRWGLNVVDEFLKEYGYPYHEHMIVNGSSVSHTRLPDSYLSAAVADPEEYSGSKNIAVESKYQRKIFFWDLNEHAGWSFPFCLTGSHWPWKSPHFYFPESAYQRALKAMRSARFEHSEAGGSIP